jgi:hypothetical protein
MQPRAEEFSMRIAFAFRSPVRDLKSKSYRDGKQKPDGNTEQFISIHAASAISAKALSTIDRVIWKAFCSPPRKAGRLSWTQTLKKQ